MGSFFSGPQGTIALSITVAALVAAGAAVLSSNNIFTGQNSFTGTQTTITNLANGNLTYNYYKVIGNIRNSTFFEKNQTNNIILSGSVPETIIADAISKGGNIYLSAGNYSLSAAFAGFNLPSNTHFIMDENAFLYVPSGYSKYVLKINPSDVFTTIQGGHISERNTILHKWIGIVVQAGSPTTAWNTIDNVQIQNSHTGLLLNGSGSGNSAVTNMFSNSEIGQSVYGVQFNYTGYNSLSSDGFNRNMFYKFDVQSSPITLFGYRNVAHSNNEFYHDKVFDPITGEKTMLINTTSTGTYIVGGRLTSPTNNYTDNGVNTQIYDGFRGLQTPTLFGNMTLAGGTSGSTLFLNSTVAEPPLVFKNCPTTDPTSLQNGAIWCTTNSLGLKYQMASSKFFVATLSAGISQTWANTVDRITNSWIFNNGTLVIPGNGHGIAFSSQTQAANNTLIVQRTGTQTNNYVGLIGTRNFTTPGAPAGTTSTTGVMTGLLATLTPKYGDNMTITVSGDMASTALADGVKIDLRYQVGNTCSSNGVAITGTTVGNPLQVTAVNTNADTYPFSITGYVTGLSAGTKYCIELGQYAITAGTATITNLSVFATENQ